MIQRIVPVEVVLVPAYTWEMIHHNTVYSIKIPILSVRAQPRFSPREERCIDGIGRPRLAEELNFSSPPGGKGQLQHGVASGHKAS